MDDYENIKVLNELHKGAKMGMDSISFVSDKVEDSKFKDNLSFQYTEYSQFLDRINKLFENYGEIPDENAMKEKVMSWTGIQMNTLNDKSTSHLADLLIQGTNMGIIKGRKLLNSNPSISEDVRSLLDNFVVTQENSINQLKKFL